MTVGFYETYNLLIQDKDFPGIQVVKKVEFETQENPSLVNFDYQTVMEYEDNPSVELLGFYHTHPHDHALMSLTDIETMKAWSACLGRGLLCLIGCNVRYGAGTMELVKGWRCFKKACIPVVVKPFVIKEENYNAFIDFEVNMLSLSRYLIKE